MRTILFDASAVAYWRHFARIKDDTKPTAAAWIADFLSRTPHDEHFVVGDSKLNWRTALVPEYKAQRPARPLEVTVQLTELAALPSHVCVEGSEADDTIGAMVEERPGAQIVVVSNDKDLHQLVSDRVIVYDPMRDVAYDTVAVIEKWGVHPERMRALLALMGDKSDNLPGVPGIGKERAAKICRLMNWEQIALALAEKRVKSFENTGLTFAAADLVVTFRETVLRNYEVIGLRTVKS